MKAKIVITAMLILSLSACSMPQASSTSNKSRNTDTYTVQLNDTTVEYHKPEGFYDVTEDYLNTMNSTYNIDKLKEDNLICLGNTDNLFHSTDAITAAPISTTKSIYRTLYGEDFDVEQVAYSSAYQYMKTGELPANLPNDYSMYELDPITVGDLTYYLYSVSYSTSYDREDSDEPGTYGTQSLMCYTNTGLDDDMEIIVYLGEWKVETAVVVLKEFLGID